MQTIIGRKGFTLWLSDKETWDWSTRSRVFWLKSRIAGNRFAAHYGRVGLISYSVDGRDDVAVPKQELDTIVADHMRKRLPIDHPARSGAVGEFE